VLGGRRHRAQQDGDIIEQPVRPGEFEERVDENQDQPDAFDLPQRRRGRKVAWSVATTGAMAASELNAQ